MITTVERLTATRFSVLAQRLADEARRRGLAAPGFRSPPGIPGAHRTIRRAGGQAPGQAPAHVIVAVRRGDRPAAEVVADMVEGVVVANHLGGPDAARLRDELRASVTLDGPPYPNWQRTSA